MSDVILFGGAVWMAAKGDDRWPFVVVVAIAALAYAGRKELRAPT